MKKLIKDNKKQKLDYILDFVNALDLSAYHLSRNTNLTETGILRILNGTVKNPHESTLNEIISYLDSIGTPVDNNKLRDNEQECDIVIKDITVSASEIQEQINELKKIILLSKKINHPCDHYEEMLRLKEFHLKLLILKDEKIEINDTK